MRGRCRRNGTSLGETGRKRFLTVGNDLFAGASLRGGTGSDGAAGGRVVVVVVGTPEAPLWGLVAIVFFVFAFSTQLFTIEVLPESLDSDQIYRER